MDLRMRRKSLPGMVRRFRPPILISPPMGCEEADDLPEESGLAAAGAARMTETAPAGSFPETSVSHHVVPVAGFEMAEFNVPACHEKGPF